MRTFSGIIVILVLSAITAWLLPWYWWYVAIIAFMVAVFRQQKPLQAFVTGFSGVAIFWAIAICLHDFPNQHILSSRMAKLFSLPGTLVFIIVNVLVGGLTGGLAAWSGGLMNRAFRKAKPMPN